MPRTTGSHDSEQHLRREILGWLFLRSDEGAWVNTVFCQFHGIGPWAYTLVWPKNPGQGAPMTTKTRHHHTRTRA